MNFTWEKKKTQKGRRTQKGALGYLGGGLNLSIVSCQLSRYDYITSSIISYRMKGLKMILRTKYNNKIERLKSQSGARGDPNTMSVNEWDQIHVCKKPNVWSRQSRWSRWGFAGNNIYFRPPRKWYSIKVWLKVDWISVSNSHVSLVFFARDYCQHFFF